MTPAAFACCSMAAPDAASRSTIMSTLTPEASICCAMVFIFAAEPSAFWMSHWRLYVEQAAFRALGSAVTQRGEDVVSGRMMPTFAPFPSIVPPPALAELLVDAGGVEPVLVAGGAEELLPPPLELHAARANAAAAPSTATDIVLLRIRTPSRGGPLLA